VTGGVAAQLRTRNPHGELNGLGQRPCHVLGFPDLDGFQAVAERAAAIALPGCFRPGLLPGRPGQLSGTISCSLHQLPRLHRTVPQEVLVPLPSSGQYLFRVHPQPCCSTRDPGPEPDSIQPQVLYQHRDRGDLLRCPGQAGVLVEPAQHLIREHLHLLQRERHLRPVRRFQALDGLAQPLRQLPDRQVRHAEQDLAGLDPEPSPQVGEGLGRGCGLVESALFALFERDQHGFGRVEGESGTGRSLAQFQGGLMDLFGAVEQHDHVIAVPERRSQALKHGIEVMSGIQVGQQTRQRVALRQRLVSISTQGVLDGAIEQRAGAITGQAVEQIQRRALLHRVKEALEVGGEGMAPAGGHDGAAQGREDAAPGDAGPVRHHRVAPPRLQVGAEQLVEHGPCCAHLQRRDGQDAWLGRDGLQGLVGPQQPQERRGPDIRVLVDHLGDLDDPGRRKGVQPAEHVLLEYPALVVHESPGVLDPGLDDLDQLLALLLPLVIELIRHLEQPGNHAQFIDTVLDPDGRHRDLHERHGHHQVVDTVESRPSIPTSVPASATTTHPDSGNRLS
jgi:hypothetical protein